MRPNTRCPGRTRHHAQPTTTSAPLPESPPQQRARGLRAVPSDWPAQCWQNRLTVASPGQRIGQRELERDPADGWVSRATRLGWNGRPAHGYHERDVIDSEATKSTRIGVILWREKFMIVAAVVLMVGLAFVYTAKSPKVYQATGILEVSVPSAQGTTDTTVANQALAQNYAALLASPGFLTLVRPTVLHGSLSVAALQARLTATAITSSALVQLDATGPSPASAQAVASQVIAGFLSYLQTSSNRQSALLEAQLQQSITALSGRGAHRAAGEDTNSFCDRTACLAEGAARRAEHAERNADHEWTRPGDERNACCGAGREFRPDQSASLAESPRWTHPRTRPRRGPGMGASHAAPRDPFWRGRDGAPRLAGAGDDPAQLALRRGRHQPPGGLRNPAR